jgi:hypothetical protein
MSTKKKTTKAPAQAAAAPAAPTLKERFLAIEHEWATVRVGYIRELSPAAKLELEAIYRELYGAQWFPNRFCKSCYFEGIQQMIETFGV